MLATQFPMVNAYARAALMHRNAARTLLLVCPRQGASLMATEVIYLSGYIAECGLKAYLMTHTPPRRHDEMINRFKNPRDIGHDLERITGELNRRNVVIPDRQLGMVRRIRWRWNPQMRYVAGSRTTEMAAEIYRDADGFYRWISGVTSDG